MSTEPMGIAQPTISKVLQEFLGEQQKRLKPRTFRRYYDFAHNQAIGKILERVDDRFIIERIKPGKLWLSGLLCGEGTIGPITVPRAITDLAEESWMVILGLGRTRRGWKILDVGNVYPM